MPTANVDDDIVIDVLRSTRGAVLLVLSLAAGAGTLALAAGHEPWVGRVVVLALAMKIGPWMSRAVRLVIDARRARADAHPGERTLGAAAAFVVNLGTRSVLVLPGARA